MAKYPIYNIQRFNCNVVNSSLYINTFKNHLVTHSFVEEPHRHNSYVLVFFTQGSGTHEIDFDVFDIQSGSMFFMQPGQIHHWHLSEDVEGYVVFYSQEFYNLYFGQKDIADYPFYSAVDNKPELVLQTDETLSIVPYFERLIAESQSPQPWQKDYILNLLDCIHIQIARKYERSNLHQAHAYNVKIKAFETELEKHYKTEKAASFYAAQLHITLKHLNRICNERLQKTTTEVITDRVILEAKRMLFDKDFTVNEIALRLGYEDYSYFTRLFKKHTGLTPSHFRTTKN